MMDDATAVIGNVDNQAGPSELERGDETTWQDASMGQEEVGESVETKVLFGESLEKIAHLEMQSPPAKHPSSPSPASPLHTRAAPLACVSPGTSVAVQRKDDNAIVKSKINTRNRVLLPSDASVGSASTSNSSRKRRRVGAIIKPFISPVIKDALNELKHAVKMKEPAVEGAANEPINVILDNDAVLDNIVKKVTDAVNAALNAVEIKVTTVNEPVKVKESDTVIEDAVNEAMHVIKMKDAAGDDSANESIDVVKDNDTAITDASNELKFAVKINETVVEETPGNGVIEDVLKEVANGVHMKETAGDNVVNGVEITIANPISVVNETISMDIDTTSAPAVAEMEGTDSKMEFTLKREKETKLRSQKDGKENEVAEAIVTPRAAPSRRRSAPRNGTDPQQTPLKEKALSWRSALSHPSIDTPTIMITGIEVTDELLKIITDLGGVITDQWRDATVLVSDNVIRRTVKFLCGISSVKAVVQESWLHASAKANKFVEFDKYGVKDAAAEKKWDFKLSSTLTRTDRSKLLQGKTFYIAEGCQPSPSDFANIIQCAGGRLVSSLKSCKSDLIIISTSELSEQNERMAALELPIYDKELVLCAILRQDFDLSCDQYRINLTESPKSKHKRARR